MRISISNKTMSFEEFADAFGDSFKAYPEPYEEMAKWYKKLTGNVVSGTPSAAKKNRPGKIKPSGD